jgi:hypothetical protein
MEQSQAGQAVSRYESTKLRNLGPVNGFIIHTPDNRELKDTHPQVIVRELNRLNDHIQWIENAIRKTLDENRHLADGENCTLIELKKALPEWT